MYVIFIHVSGIALLEILFYFYYIGPIESELLKNSMRHIAINQINEYFFIVQKEIFIEKIISAIDSLRGIFRYSDIGQVLLPFVFLKRIDFILWKTSDRKR